MANLGLSLMPIGERDDRGHLVHGRHEGHRQQHHRGQGRRSCRSTASCRIRRRSPATYRTEHADEVGLSRRARAGHGADSRRRRSWASRAPRSSTSIGQGRRRAASRTRRSATQAESSGFQMLVAEAAMKIDTAFLHALPRGRRSRSLRAGEARHPDLTARARVRMDTALAAKYCREAVELLVAGARHVEPGRQQPHAAALARRPRRQPSRHHRVAGESRGLRQGAARRRAEHHALDYETLVNFRRVA